jgi:uncharacterized protein (UPF0333 family)
MNKRGQAAMEFLMTYGWAIVVVLAAIGALAYFGVLSPQKLLPDRTTFSAPVPNVDNAVITTVDATTATVEVAFRNNKGVSIEIPGTTSSWVSAGSTPCTAGNITAVTATDGTTSLLNTPISNGVGFNIEWTCSHNAAIVGDKFKADISFDYINSETGQTIKQTGSVEGKYS